ncbi:MAG TPA: triose-phosphate isomerase [Bacteroidota bacterium]|nr:triose-phosphate isomerase [Bacteroidota bacterium]
MRRKLVAGNWKMNKNIDETAELVRSLAASVKDLPADADIVICPPFVSLVIAKPLLENTRIGLGAQNMSQQDDGAFTGETSARMLLSAGCTHVILGHSERRQFYGENDPLINKKVQKAIAAGLTPIVCVGETLQERESGITDRVITAQIKGVLAGISADDIGKVVIAYEPVWAIGTGKNATPQQANDVHRLIRKLLGQLYSWAAAEQLIILYGGSVNAQNAGTLFREPDIDGGLIGGASLKADGFTAIITAALEASKK